MTTLIFDRDEELVAWAESVYPDCAPMSRPLKTIGIASDTGELMGVAIYTDFRDNDVQVSIVTATPRWATSGNVRALLHYPFVQLGKQRMTAITAKSNKKARRLLSGLGFVLEGTHPYAAKGKTACTYGLYSDNAKRWLNG